MSRSHRIQIRTDSKYTREIKNNDVVSGRRKLNSAKYTQSRLSPLTAVAAVGAAEADYVR